MTGNNTSSNLTGTTTHAVNKGALGDRTNSRTNIEAYSAAGEIGFGW